MAIFEIKKITNMLKRAELNIYSLFLIIVILVLAFLGWVFITFKNDCSLRPTERGVIVCKVEKEKKISAIDAITEILIITLDGSDSPLLDKYGKPNQ